MIAAGVAGVLASRPGLRQPSHLPYAELVEAELDEERLSAGDQGIDVLAPWGEDGPPPADRWRKDVLGRDYESRTIPVTPDAEGENVATLVRLVPSLTPEARRAPRTDRVSSFLSGLPGRLASGGVLHRPRPRRFAVLYIHGRNDYFFQDEMARSFQSMGGVFYALDLRKYGRSLRPWQTIGYTTDLGVYDEEIGAAVSALSEENPGLPLIVVGHSTGGLIATLWAWRNQDLVAGLILNSAWLELQVHSNMRPALHQVALRLGQIRPRTPLVGTSKSNTYYRSIAEGWKDSGLPIPKYFEDAPSDPALVGWPVFPEWKLPFSYPAPAAWLAAVLAGHAAIEKDVHLDCPVLAMASTNSDLEEENWGEQTFRSDVVLDSRLITERAALLSDSVVIQRFPGKHDLMLSDPPVRRDIYSTIRTWIDDCVLNDRG